MNAGPRATTSALCSEEAGGRYEDLRRHIIEGFGSRPRLGLAVLVREGLAAWITTWTTTSTGRDDPSDGAVRRLANDAHGELVHVLAAMALHRIDRRDAP